MPVATVLPAGRFELLEDEGRTTLTRRKSPVPLLTLACVLVALAGALPVVLGPKLAFAPILPGILLTIAIFVQTNQIGGRGFYFRVRRALSIERAPGASYRDGGGAPRMLVDGVAVPAAARDVVIRATRGPQPAWQIYVLLVDGGLVHVAGTIDTAEAEAMRRALRAALALPDDRSPPAPDAVGVGALVVLLVLLVAHVFVLVGLAAWAADLGRQAPVAAGALAAGGVLAACAVFAGGIALFARAPLRAWVRAVHAG